MCFLTVINSNSPVIKILKLFNHIYPPNTTTLPPPFPFNLSSASKRRSRAGGEEKWSPPSLTSIHLRFEPLHLLHLVCSLPMCTSRPGMDKRAEESAAFEFAVRVFSLREKEEHEEERTETEILQRPQEVRKERVHLPLTWIDEVVVSVNWT